MSTRVEQELALLQRRWRGLEYVEDGHWVRLPPGPVPAGWSHATAEICFRIPAEAATPPYGFYVNPALLITTGDTTQTPTNYTASASTPFDGEWAMFSWSPLGWNPQAEVTRGDNMVHFVRSFQDRLEQLE
jgi:hypothetical protein